MLFTLLIPLSVVSLALILAVSLSINRRAEILSVEDWEARKQDVDIEVFRALIDRDDWRYLRDSLSPGEFQVFQRKRILLALRMLRLAERDTNLLMELARHARQHADPVRRQQADELLASAIQFRLNLTPVRLCLCLQWLLPSRALLLPVLAARYEHLCGSLVQFQNNCQQLS